MELIFSFYCQKVRIHFQSNALGDNQNNIYGNRFELIFIVNISSPKSNDTLISNTYSNINLNGF